MANDTKIRPALTAEEWPRLAYTAESSDDRLSLSDDCVLDSDGGIVAYPEERHALAALALYGQPFGFTRADVDLLRELANPMACGARRDGITDDAPAFQAAFRVANLADRIAALLPPHA